MIAMILILSINNHTYQIADPSRYEKMEQCVSVGTDLLQNPFVINVACGHLKNTKAGK